MEKFLAIGSACLFLAACERPNAPALPAQTGQVKAASAVIVKVPQPAPLQIDLSSPDRAVKTWWNFVDARSEESHAECLADDAIDQKSKSNLRWSAEKVTDGPVLQQYQANRSATCASPSKLAREILEVKVESETRAIVFALVKDVSVPAAGSVPDELDLKMRPAGLKGKYLMEKTNEGWKVAQIYAFNRFRLRGEPEWEEIYTRTVDSPPRYPGAVYGHQL